MATHDRREKEQAKKRAAKKAAQDKRRQVAGTSQGSRTRVVEGVDLTEEQYRSYQELRRTDPAAASQYVDTVKAYPDRPDQAESVKATLKLSAKQRGETKKKELEDLEYGRLTESRKQFEQRLSTTKVEPVGSATAAERAASETWPTLAPSQRTNKPQARYEKDKGSQPAGKLIAPKGGSAVEQYLTSRGKPYVGPLKPTLATGVSITGDEKIWLGETGGVYAPSRGHMNDPDAPGGRLAGPEATQYSTINQYYIKLWEMTPLERMEFQRAQGLPPTGALDQSTQDAWKNVLVHAARLTAAGQKVTPESLYGFKLDSDKTGKRGGPAGPGEAGGGPRTTTQVALTNRGEAKKLLNAIFRQKLGRAVTEDEVSMFQAQLNSSEKKHPKTSTGELNAAGSLETQNVSGGLDAEQFTEDYLMETKGGEANARMVGVDYFDAALKAIGAAV